MRRHRLRVALAGANAGAVLALLVLFGLLFRAAVHAVLWRRVDEGLDRKVAALQRMYAGILVDPAHEAERRAEAERTVSSLERELRRLPGSRGAGTPRAWPIRVLGPDGRAYLRAYARMQGVDEPWDRRLFERSMRGATVRRDSVAGRLVSVPLRVGGEVRGVVQGVEPLTEANAILADVDATLRTAVPVAAILSAALGWVLATLALRPVRALSRALCAIDPDRPEALPLRADELSPISESFNVVLARLRHVFGALEKRAVRQRDFTDEVSHELRSPLTVVKANAGFLLAQEGLSPADRDALEAILAASRSMGRLVEDLLLVARAEGGAVLHPEPVDLGALLKEMDRRELPLRLDVEPGLTVVADREHLARVFRNLLDNAHRHGRASVARVTARTVEGEARIVVEDDGVGMAPDVLARLGERFFRGSAAREGHGLGVSICRSLVEAHGGEIAFESRVGEGTRVVLRLPAASLRPTFTKTLI